MGESASAEPADGDGDAASSTAASVIAIAADGDIVLDVTFETSKETLKKLRAQLKSMSLASRSKNEPKTPPSTRLELAYRVSSEALKKHSKYFANLLSNPQFSEHRRITDSHAALIARGIQPAEAEAAELPRVEIVDDDQATQASGREVAFKDMLLMLHKLPISVTKLTMSYMTTLAIMADRFDCAATVAKSAGLGAKFKGPVTSTRAYFDEHGRATETENVLRQKLLISILLGQPTQLAAASRELILRGSAIWNVYHEPEEGKDAAWWHLPEGIEDELRYRRECILNTVASVQRHFLNLYSSRERQCKLGYDSSSACDSFQLGQMVKFLSSKSLLFLMDYSPSSLDSAPDATCIDIQELLATLRQCPSYQLDKNHTNCGLRIRIEPILDYLRTMLSTNVISIPLVEWRRNSENVKWQNDTDGGDSTKDKPKREFLFTRAVANDQRLRYEGAMYVDKTAKSLFTSEAWHWTPEL